ncbi:MAG: EamA family transporter [Alphaproteobacteria bacterium]|nr:EamA family transporter [Alphaproteobacteria bacterium]
MGARDVSQAVAAALIWGATFPISAIALESTPPIFFAFLRFLGAAAFVAVIRRPAVPWPKLVLVGLLLGAGQYGFMFVAMTQGISAGLASLLVHTQALFTIVIAMIVFSERLNRRQVAAIALALSGLACLVVNRAEAGALTGLVLVLVAAVCGASGNNVLKSLGKVDMLGVAVWMSLAAPLPLLALSIWFEADGSVTRLVSTISWETVGAVAYSAVLATVLAFAIWGRLFATHSAATVAPFFLLVPVFGLSLSALVLDERLSNLQLLGAVLIFVGLVMVLWPKRAPA